MRTRQILVAGLVLGPVALLGGSLPTGGSHLVRSDRLPALDGTRLRSTLVEVSYGPGESSPAHSHPCPVTGYVIEGHLRVGVDGLIDSVFGPGESFFEPPNGVHRVSANASSSEPVRFLAFFVCDREGPLTVPPPAGRAP